MHGEYKVRLLQFKHPKDSYKDFFKQRRDIKLEQKIYYQDVYRKQFYAKGIKQVQDENGKWYILLSETAFYPTGGGQPHDLGTLNGVNVTNVEELDGEIRHFIEGPISNTEEIKGAIDWSRRFDHMQQHAGQHILTASFVQLFGAETVSFHLGKETSTIDLQVDKLTAEMVVKAEQLANQIILENRSIETKWVTKEEADQYKLRKELSVSENIRLVIIPEFDYNGCGGTHPRSTGEVASIKILNWEKQKKNIRVQFVCGNRVLNQLHQKQNIMLALRDLLSSPEQEIVGAVNRLLENEKVLAKKLEVLQERLLQYEAKELLKTAMMWGEEKVISIAFQDRQIQQLQKLSKMVINEDEEMNVIFTTVNGKQLQFVCTRGTKANLNMKEITKQILPIINGKGGGNETSAQGGGDALLSGEELIEQIKGIIV